MLQISTAHKNAPDQSNVSIENPLELLLSCHEKIIHFSSALLALTAVLKQDGWSDELTTSAKQIRHYFNIASHEHHLDEENHLFPAIISLDPELKKAGSIKIIKLLNRMIKEHVESDALWQTLDAMLEEKSEDFNTLAKLASQFKASMHEHVKIENEQIFPYAKTHINKAELKTIGQAIAERRGIKPINIT